MKKRIFIGPSEIAGYYNNLHQGFLLLNENAEFVSYANHLFEYNNMTSKYWFIRFLNYINSKKNISKNNIFYSLIKNILKKVATLIFLFRFDVFIFSFGRSLLPNNNDLWLLRLLNKKIIFVMAHGSEMRPPYINGAYQSKDGNIQPNSKFLKKLSFKIKKRILKNEKYSDYIIGAPFSSTQFATKKFINSFLVGIPYIKNKKNNTNKSMSNSLRILHCPSHPAGKGSDKIQTIVNKLKKRGHIFDFILLSNRPHHEVLTEIKKCDFIIDQIYSDTPLAGFAMEAALFKKPAIVGGYKLNELKKYFPDTPYPPSYICHPNDLEKGIEKLILNKDFRINLGKIANKFINDYFSADKVANNFLRIINDDIPNSWWIDPNDVTYLEGTAQSIEQTKINIQKLVNKYGKESLQLSHHPKLEKAFLKFAKINGKS